jgi:nucleoside-diphosphate-sugar epimerase
MLSFVTGATGFIGGRLVDALLQEGHTVRVLVRDPGRAASLQRPGVEVVRGDLGDAASLKEAVSGAQQCFHCAGLVGDWLRPEDAQRVNVDGTRALLAACTSAGVERVVYLSSLSVYGLGQHRGTDEAAPLRYSNDTYIDSKIDAERMVRVLVDRGGPEVVILRPGFVYGPGDRLFLPKLLDALARRQFVYVGDGSKLLNLSYVDDVAAAMLLAASVPAAAGQAYNLTDGTETSLRAFVELLCFELGIPAPAKRIPPAVAWAACYGAETLARARRATEAPRLSRGRMRFLYYNQHYSGEKARGELGYRPQFTCREGVPPTLAWYREHGLLPASPAVV